MSLHLIEDYGTLFFNKQAEIVVHVFFDTDNIRTVCESLIIKKRFIKVYRLPDGTYDAIPDNCDVPAGSVEVARRGHLRMLTSVDEPVAPQRESEPYLDFDD